MTLSPLSSSRFWEDPETVDDFLSSQLARGRLALVLGAGASFGFGLPSWPSLVGKMFQKKSVTQPEGKLTDICDLFQDQHFGGNRQAFANFVRECLYEDARVDDDALLRSRLLQALGALLSKSARGTATCVISFNFDDMLENYLDVLGLVTRSIDSMPSWSSTADIRVFHPHGLLPFDENRRSSSSGIVFTASDFVHVIGDAAESWNQKMLDIFTSHTCLFLGLSGDDDRLMSLLHKANGIHPGRQNGEHYNWGIRTAVSSEAEVIRHKWKKNRVAIRDFTSYDDIPAWVLSLCRKAAAQKTGAEY